MYIGVRAGLLAASAIWAISTAAAQAEDLQAPAAAASASALTDGETKNLVVARADTGQAPVQVAQLGVEHVTISARRVDEDIQKVPIPVSVVSDAVIANTGAYNLERLTQLQPSLQVYSQNPRNTSINIRGIGAPLGLTNDGIEQGVGVYVDQVYYNRVAATTLDFVDVERIEVLRGPQGTLYGKNTTAGAVNITTRGPNFDGFEARGEISGGNFEFKQAKASISAPITDDIAFRLSLAQTTRRGTVYNTATQSWTNGQDNLGLRGTVQWNATPDLKLTVSADYNVQDAACCALYYARVGTTQRPLNRQ